MVLDAVGHIEAIGLGELLGRQDVDVTVVTALSAPISLDPETQQAALPLGGAGGGWPGDPTPCWAPSATTRSPWSMPSPTPSSRWPASTGTVIRTHGRPENALVAELEGKVPEVVAVGDAVAARSAHRAIWDGHQAGRCSGSPRASRREPGSS